MGKEVIVKVIGTQVGTTNETITTEEKGSMLYKEPYYYVSYEEHIDTESSTKSKTTLRFSEKELRVTRKGEVVSTLEFENDKEHNSIYMTPFGNFEVLLITDELKIDCKETSASLYVDYRIGLNSMPPTKGRLEIYICEK